MLNSRGVQITLDEYNNSSNGEITESKIITLHLKVMKRTFGRFETSKSIIRGRNYRRGGFTRVRRRALEEV